MNARNHTNTTSSRGGGCVFFNAADMGRDNMRDDLAKKFAETFAPSILAELIGFLRLNAIPTDVFDREPLVAERNRRLAAGKATEREVAVACRDYYPAQVFERETLLEWLGENGEQVPAVFPAVAQLLDTVDEVRRTLSFRLANETPLSWDIVHRLDDAVAAARKALT